MFLFVCFDNVSHSLFSFKCKFVCVYACVFVCVWGEKFLLSFDCLIDRGHNSLLLLLPTLEYALLCLCGLSEFPLEERDIIVPPCVCLCECVWRILEVSWRETASTTATMTTTTITRCYWDGGGFVVDSG